MSHHTQNLLVRLDEKASDLVRRVRTSPRWHAVATAAEQPHLAEAAAREVRAAVQACRPVAAEVSGVALQRLMPDNGTCAPSAAVCGTFWVLARQDTPHGYMGALCALEILSSLVASLCDAERDRAPRSIGEPFRALLRQAIEEDPNTTEAFEDGMRCLAEVYPLPIVEWAVERAEATTPRPYARAG